MMDQTQECVICQQLNDQMLMLTCVHDPCINCALTHYVQESNGRVRYNMYTCSICGEVTPLDISSVVQLERMIPATKRVHSPNTQLPIHMVSKKKPVASHSNSPKLVVEQSVPAPRYTHYQQQPAARQQMEEVDLLKEAEYPSNPPPKRPSVYSIQLPVGGPTSRRNGCREHDEEQVTYYCFTCLANICPECAIHVVGAHQGHSVKQIKKAIGEIKSQFLGIVERVQRVANHFKGHKENFSRSLGSFAQLHARHRRSVSEYFELMRREISKKETELLTKLDQLHQNNLRLIHTKIESFNHQKEEADKLSASVLNTLKKDDLTILEEYSRQTRDFKEILQKYESEPHEQRIEGMKTVNSNQLRDFTSEIASLVSKLDLQWTDLQENQLHIRTILGET